MWDTIQVLREIEAACGIPFTGIVNNSNLGEQTAPEDVLASLPYADQIAWETGLSVRFTSVRADLVPALTGKVETLFPLTLQKKYY